MQQGSSDCTSVAVIVGVPCMIGFSLAEALKKPTAPGSPWKVYGLARRPLPEWFPPGLLHGFISFDALDLNDTIQKLSPISHEVTHVFWVAVQRRESEEKMVTLNLTMLANVISVLKSATPSRLRHITLQTGTKHYIGPIFDSNFRNLLVHREPPFQEDMPRLPYTNYYYALEDLLQSYTPSLTYSVHRSSIIIGASSRSVHNTLLTLSVYATICRFQGLPFRYPGSQYTWEHFCDMSDASLLAEQQIWAATTDKAKNQAFNCTNGDVFTWKSLWKVMCELFDLEFLDVGEENKGVFDWVKWMGEKSRVWDEIVEKHGLFKTKLEDVTCPAALTTVLNFKFQHVCSMNKSREFGFLGYANTLRSIRLLVGRLREMKIIPSKIVCICT